MKDSEILRKVRTCIRNCNSHAICSAIDRVGIIHGIDYNQLVRLKRWIRKMLGKHAYYEDWLFAKHRDVMRNMTSADFCQGRLQWLDWMIDYCEKEEAKKVPQAKHDNMYALAA